MYVQNYIIMITFKKAYGIIYYITNVTILSAVFQPKSNEHEQSLKLSTILGTYSVIS